MLLTVCNRISGFYWGGDMAQLLKRRTGTPTEVGSIPGCGKGFFS